MVQQSAISCLIARASKAVAKLRSRFIKYPTFTEAKAVREGFHEIGKFPGMHFGIAR